MYLITQEGEPRQVRVDKGNNVFVNGKCANPKGYEDMTLQENADDVRENIDTGYFKEGLLVQVTGHVPVFSYGHTRDEDGKPVCVKVNTGQDGW